MRILFLEPFYGGSHRDVVDNLLRFSSHDVTLDTLPAHHWKWRLRSSGLHFAETVSDPESYDLVVTTGMTTVADMQRAWGCDRPPLAIYVHETQLTYPTPKGESVDLHLAFTDVQNLLAAESIRFNSRTHKYSFLHNLRTFLRKMPRPRLEWAHDKIAEKSKVLYPGIAVPSCAARAASLPRAAATPKDGPLIIWNHRWEFDKAPEVFFEVLRSVKGEGVPFSLAILGESFQSHPRIFEEAQETFAEQIVQFGFAADRDTYEAWLCRGDIIVSTAIQENFGISVLEAVAAGCFPLLPNRLSYPEVIPERFHDRVLYESPKDLVRRISELARDPAKRALPPDLQNHARSFSWEHQTAEWDAWMRDVVEDAKRGKS